MTARRRVLELLDTPSCDTELTWTTGNVAEAFPGVFTTLGFGFTHEPMELAFRTMFARLGVFGPGEIHLPERIEDTFWTLFAGRAAANIDKFRQIANVTPGTSATAVEQQLFGYVRPTTVDDNSYRRYPIILAKAPAAVISLPRRHDAMFAELRTWRLDRLSRIEELDEQGCRRVLADARARFQRIMVLHLIVAFVSSGLAERLAAMVAKLDLPGLEARLLSGVGSDENEVAHDLWALAHGELRLPDFTARHGYHGTNEGQLSGVSWREDPAPVLARLDDYRSISADSPRAPRRRAVHQAETRRAAMAELTAATPRLRRSPVTMLTNLAARWLALREQGKAGYLLTFDVARAACRRMGEHLVAQGVIDDREDVFHLGYDAVLEGVHGDVRDLVARRRTEYEERLDLRLPQSWTGMPEVTKVGEPTSGSTVDGVIKGVAASSGQVEGRARVVRDPATTELDDGDILVCETTDPSWVSLFLVAGGVVTDFGGMLSHGPIVAREMGIPCVCGTEDGSWRIPDGAWIRVDGDAGTVEIVGAPA
ncbi:phosphoenolpyruvate carboxykinase [Amycolatopsis sp. K13G38]|uniref:Phosphoenolpyruvate carboxykinase n=1 Tax=Amycolatopsis acididurans TaxID=2724524 RepID=A0ABX1J700_9PSEU|nr:PEP-utilizing enzyme [Amycolatopsis acididurans]NKQ54185.1 phosphoenolpyruvate carboxykinase [Amycolatopsis acididurans]